MKVSPGDVNSLLKNPSKEFFAYLLHGLDVGLIDERAQKLALLFSDDLEDPFSVSKLTGKELQANPVSLSDALNSMALFGSLKTVILSGTAAELTTLVKTNIDNLNADCRLIISAKESTTRHSLVTMCDKHPKIASIACYPDEDKQLQKLVSEIMFKSQINISHDLVKYTSEKLGSNRAINKSEIEKIALYAATTKKINKEDIDILLGDNSSHLLDKLINNVFTGKTKGLGELISIARSESIQPIVIIRSFQSYVKILMSVNASMENGLTAQVAVNNIRPPIYFKRKQDVVYHSKIFSMIYCSKILEKLVKLEKQYKTGSTPDPYSLIGQSLLGIAIASSYHRV